MKFFTGTLLGIAVLFIAVSTLPGCAQIGSPTGGVRDSLPPVIVKTNPPNGTTNFSGNKITLSFDEYIELQDVSNNIYISPFQKNNPAINYNLRTVSVRLRDTLLPNTTYSISFGNAIRDVNESNILRDYTYVFSTGDIIDSLELTGLVLMAQTGLPDSSLMVLLYRNLADSAVRKIKPQYIARLKGDGSFRFNNLPPGSYRVYALGDGDNGKTYNAKSEAFAFLDSVVVVSERTNPVMLYAYQEEKRADNNKPIGRQISDKRFRYSTSLKDSLHEITEPLRISFNRPLKTLQPQTIKLFDSLNLAVALPPAVIDSTGQAISFAVKWKPGAAYTLVIPADIATDSAGNGFSKPDTIGFSTKKPEDYGNLVLRFKNLDLSRHPVLEFLDGENIIYAYPLKAAEFNNKMFPPGEYSIRILYDRNENGKWDPGNYDLKLQPERGTSLSQKIAIRANWDNERDITLEE